MIGKTIRALYYILFFVVPLIVIPSTSELFELNKMIAIYAVALCIFCGVAVDAIIHGPQTVLRRTPFDKPLGVFLAVMTLSWIFSIDHHTSFFGYYGRFNGGLLSLFAFTVLYYGASWYFTREHVLKLLKVTVVTSVLVMIWGLSGKLGFDFSCLIFTGQFNNSCWTDQFRPAERMFSTLGQPNWLGAYLAAHFFLGLYMYLTKARNKGSEWMPHIPYGLYLILTFMCLLFTRSRSALIAWGVGCALVGVYFLVRRSKHSYKPVASIAFASVLLVLTFKSGIAQVDRYISFPTQSQKQPVVVAQTPSAPSAVTESFDIRKIVWSGAWELGMRYPLLGTGPETFAYSYYLVRPIAHNLTSEWDYIYNKAHNEYLNYLATTGFIGLAAYIGLSVVFFFYLLRKFKSARGSQEVELVGVTFATAYCAVIITNFFGFSTSTSQLLFFIVPALAVSLIEPQTASARSKITLAFREYTQLATVGVIGVVGGVWIVLFLIADLNYAQGVSALSQGDYPLAASKIRRAMMYHSEHIYEDRYSTALANIALLASFSEKPSSADAYITLSRYYIDHALKRSPKNPLYWRTKGKNEYTFYQAKTKEVYIDEAIQGINRAFTLAPTDPKLPYTLGLLYGVTNRQEESLKYMDRSIALKPDYLDAYILKLKLLRAWKKTNDAAVLEEQILKSFPSVTRETLDADL